MKKLSLLKPDKNTVYLEFGKGQEVNYLHISPKLDRDSLERDVKAGAVQFQECLEYTEKRPSQMIIIDCQNEEEGLMAVSYLAGVHNWKDGVYEDVEPDEYDEYDEDIEYYASEDREDYDLEDFEGWENVLDEENEDEEDPETYDWHESPCRIPIVTMSQLIDYSNNGMSCYSEGPVFMGGQQNGNSRKPYWLTVRKEPICILVDLTQPIGFGFMGFQSDKETRISKEMKRFVKNRHVYVVVIGSPLAKKETTSFDDDEESWESVGLSLPQQVISELILEYTAGTVKVDCEEEERKKYHTLLFENWAYELGMKLEKRFPKREITEQIVSMRNSNKSELIEKVYRYVLSQDRESNVLKKDDFSILKRFRTLGVSASEKEKQKSVQKLETTLIGMENVKRQVHSIVNVMKFNKLREEKGVGKGSYHNVHLLIGAPGTAKTTVAQLMGNIMCEQKLLPGNRFVSINGADLKGMFVGHSAPKTKRYFEEYDIILIDEAYSLTSDKEMDSFSQEAIAQLIIELEKHGTDKLVMFAGYGGKHVSDKDNKMTQAPLLSVQCAPCHRQNQCFALRQLKHGHSPEGVAVRLAYCG